MLFMDKELESISETITYLLHKTDFLIRYPHYEKIFLRIETKIDDYFYEDNEE